MSRLVMSLTAKGEQYLSDSYTKGLVQEVSTVTCAEGQRTSRILGRIFHRYGLDTHPEFNKKFALLADALNPIALPRDGYLSLHPCDYLEMSNELNSWNSCHNIRSGCYMAGTLSYLADASSLIFYTTECAGTPVIYDLPKVTRQVFCYADNTILQSRLYPRHSDTDTSQTYRNLVQSAIATCLRQPNRWVVKKDLEAIGRVALTWEGSQHYADYTYSAYLPTLSTLRGYESSEIEIGSTSYCLCCGDELYNSESLLCDDCGNFCHCDDCGARVHLDNAFEVEGEFYCSECVTLCEKCDRPTRDSTYVLHPDGGGMYMCEDCRDTYTFWCEHCVEYHMNDAGVYMGDCLVCKDCAKELSTQEVSV